MTKDQATSTRTDAHRPAALPEILVFEFAERHVLGVHADNADHSWCIRDEFTIYGRRAVSYHNLPLGFASAHPSDLAADRQVALGVLHALVSFLHAEPVVFDTYEDYRASRRATR